MTSVGGAIRDFQVRCLLRAQDALLKARSGGFGLPDNMALEVQEIMTKIPVLIGRLEQCNSPEMPVPKPNGGNLEVHL